MCAWSTSGACETLLSGLGFVGRPVHWSWMCNDSVPVFHLRQCVDECTNLLPSCQNRWGSHYYELCILGPIRGQNIIDNGAVLMSPDVSAEGSFPRLRFSSPVQSAWHHSGKCLDSASCLPQSVCLDVGRVSTVSENCWRKGKKCEKCASSEIICSGFLRRTSRLTIIAYRSM